MVSHYNPSAARSLRTDADITKTDFVKSGKHVSAKKSLEAVYPALGITCRDVGGYLSGSRYVYQVFVLVGIDLLLNMPY
jgi:hypothetical protein